MEHESTYDRHQLDALFATVRRHESALVLALHVGDELAGQVTVTRLVLTLRRANARIDAISTGAPSQRAALMTIRAMFEEATQGTHDLLRRVAPATRVRDSRWLTRWFMAPARSAFATSGPDLFEIDATGIALPAAAFLGLHVAHCRLITDLHCASFTDAFVEQCDLTYANLRNTLWQRTHLHRSFFRDSSFVDATFDRATFVDCDLRRADFGMVNNRGLAATTDVEFIRCDLRGANWTGRNLSGLRMEDCQLDDPPAQDVVSSVAGIQRSEIASTRPSSRAPIRPEIDQRADALCV